MNDDSNNGRTYFCPACKSDARKAAGEIVADVTFAHSCGKRAGPELLPLHMRNLPSDLVTKEIEVEDKVHVEDVPHIVKAIVKDRVRAERAAEYGVKSFLPGDPEVPENLEEDPRDHMLTQDRVDVVRLRVARAWAQTQKLRIMGEADGQQASDDTIHVVFPENDDRAYEMRLGNPPRDVERPQHLRNLRLEVDVSMKDGPAWFAGIVERLRDRGVKVDRAWERRAQKDLLRNLIVTPDGQSWQ